MRKFYNNLTLPFDVEKNVELVRDMMQKNELQDGYTYGSTPGTTDIWLRPDGSHGPGIPGQRYIQDSKGNIVSRQGDSNWSSFLKNNQNMPPVQSVPPQQPTPIFNRPQPFAPPPRRPVTQQFSQIRGALNRQRVK